MSRTCVRCGADVEEHPVVCSECEAETVTAAVERWVSDDYDAPGWSR